MSMISYAERARETLPAGLWAYLEGGAETETALQRNRDALDAVALVPRLLVDVSAVDPSTSFLGLPIAMPLLIAPIGSLHRLHDEGLDGVRRAAAGAGIAWSVGSALPDADRIEVSGSGLALYQLYIEGDDDWLDEHCRAALARGHRGVIITADAPVFPVRRRDIEVGNHAAGRSKDGTSAFRKTFTWERLAGLVERNPDVPVILKGVQDPRDAQLALQAGVAGVYVSNHGGRQFDQGRGTIELVAPIAEALGGHVPLIVDGGFHSGADVLKAIALGADIVALGRAALYPYVAEGSAGLTAFLTELREQLYTNMALLGTPRLADLRDLRAFSGTPVGLTIRRKR